MDSWKKCVICKKSIAFNQAYYRCSVSGCKSERKSIVFCSVPCWDEHRAVFGHRSAWAEEQTSPKSEGAKVGERSPRRTVVSLTSAANPAKSQIPSSLSRDISYDTLVVVSKVKKLIRDLSEFNTSQCAIDVLTERVVEECRQAVEVARSSGRKTVMGRDFSK